MLWFLSTSTPLPVVVRSMPPEQVSSLPGPDGWALLGIIAALVAAFASVIAVLIANKTYGLADRELRVVTDEFKELTRRPDIRVEGRIAYEKVRIAGAIMDGFAVTVEVSNSGRRLARSVIAELLIPKTLNPRTDPTRYPLGTYRVTALKMESEIFRVFTIDLPDLHPNEAVNSGSFPAIALGNDVAECKLLLRVYDENFGYPEHEPQWLTYRSPVLSAEAQLE
jgi:hypothetical protein